MKLYLSSYRLGNKPEELAGLVGENKKAAVITSARDAYPPDERGERLEREIEALSKIGIEGEEVKLSEYFSKPEELGTRLSNVGLFWILGGNAFVLRRAMKDSGFDRLARGLLDNGIVYAGYSAAGCVAGPTLKGIDIVDDPSEVRAAYGEEVIWEGLNLVPFSFAPHYRSDHPESAGVEKEVEYLEKQNMPYRALKDGQAIIIDGDNERTVG